MMSWGKRKTVLGSFISLVVLSFIFTNVGFAKSGNKDKAEKLVLYGYPRGVPENNRLLERKCITLSNNGDTKFADWVVYKVTKKSQTGKTVPHIFKKDPDLTANETLNTGDYNGANKALKVDKGHQAPLASFKGTSCWAEANYLSNITPQKSALNQGPWGRLETRERKLAKKYTVYSATGPLYERGMPRLPKTIKDHKVPSGYWKIMMVQPDPDRVESIKLAAFIFDQSSPRDDEILPHLVTVDEVEKRAGLDLFPDLPQGTQDSLEAQKDEEWAESILK